MNNQLQTLKLNVTNINSYLMRSNNQLQKLKKNKNQLLFKLERQSIGRRKETKIEKGLIGKGIMKTGRKLLSPAMSIFDKIKEFFGIVILGFIVNKLPKIIKAITDFLDSEFVKTTKEIFKLIGDTFTTLYNVFTDFPGFVRREFERSMKTIQDGLEFLGKTFSPLGELYKNVFSILGEDAEDISLGTMRDMGDNTQVLLKRIRDAESAGDYGAMYSRNRAGFSRGREDITKMTIDEVDQLQTDYLNYQKSLGYDQTQRSAAMGAYQMLELKKAAQDLGIDTSTTLFDKETQDFLALKSYLKDAGYDDFLKGKISAKTFNNRLAGIFASLKKVDGTGVYDDDGMNRAYESVFDLIKVIEFDRKKLELEGVKRDPNLRSNLVNSSGTRVALAIVPVPGKTQVVTETETQLIPVPVGSNRGLSPMWNPYTRRNIG